MRIGGQEVDSDRLMTIVDPSTGAPIATVARGDAGHIDAAVAAARDTFESGVWRTKTPQERAAIMRRIVAAATDVADELVELELSANGATVRQATGF
ncbi:aldehyde dehydrogenase family protein, partial [Mycolicibacterium gadium]